MKGLVEEGRKQARGQFTDRTQWNKVLVENKDIIMERGQAPKGRVRLEDIRISLA